MQGDDLLEIHVPQIQQLHAMAFTISGQPVQEVSKTKY